MYIDPSVMSKSIDRAGCTYLALGNKQSFISEIRMTNGVMIVVLRIEKSVLSLGNARKVSTQRKSLRSITITRLG